MSVFPEWERYAVPQRKSVTGCIPTGYEMILRAAQAQGIDFSKIQDEFDLDKDRKPSEAFRNNFDSVAAAIQSRYPTVRFRSVRFEPGRGDDKLRFVEEHLLQKRPLLISLANAPFGCSGWHIMPVVDMDEQNLFLLEIMYPDGSYKIQRLTKSEFVRIHDSYQGGDDVAYLESC